MDPLATLSEHHVPPSLINNGYATHDRFVFENSFGARNLASAKDENPSPHISRYDDHSSEQCVAVNIYFIILLNQHGDAFLCTYEQQDWQAAPESDKHSHFHCKQDAKDNTQFVDEDDAVFIHLVDYDLVDGHLAYAAGGTPSKPHEWMVSSPLSTNPSTAATQAHNGFSRYGKLIITGLIAPKDNEAREEG